ncbi:galectin 4-like protein transcript variant [Leptotrombidium deliense]|uniref:Galectin n=1 Tax=Leptotrombidium deliense TaxID=299467 RepID=A0A443S3U0_9ACAR|nr:galectin 4-like protein transcript variant [Leptotrombidium deliense]
MTPDVLAAYPNFENIVSKIVLPFSAPIPDEPKPGLLISIFGKVQQNANKFDITLYTAKEDIAFHFNPRFKERYVVRSSRIANAWAKEEKDGTFPFSQNRAFEIVILVEEREYKVSVNGKHHSNYQHRIDVNDVKTITINGDAVIDKVIYKLETLITDTGMIYNPIMPLTHDLSGRIDVGFIAIVRGRPGSSSTRFSINLKDDTRVFFHFDVRFDQGTVVRNYHDSNWANEERDIPYFPFSNGAGFEVLIYVREDDFVVAVNGQHFVKFTHKLLPLRDIKYCSVDGDVTVTRVCYRGYE